MGLSLRQVHGTYGLGVHLDTAGHQCPGATIAANYLGHFRSWSRRFLALDILRGQLTLIPWTSGNYTDLWKFGCTTRDDAGGGGGVHSSKDGQGDGTGPIPAARTAGQAGPAVHTGGRLPPCPIPRYGGGPPWDMSCTGSEKRPVVKPEPITLRAGGRAVGCSRRWHGTLPRARQRYAGLPASWKPAKHVWPAQRASSPRGGLWRPNSVIRARSLERACNKKPAAGCTCRRLRVVRR